MVYICNFAQVRGGLNHARTESLQRTFCDQDTGLCHSCIISGIGSLLYGFSAQRMGKKMQLMGQLSHTSTLLLFSPINHVWNPHWGNGTLSDCIIWLKTLELKQQQSESAQEFLLRVVMDIVEIFPWDTHKIIFLSSLEFSCFFFPILLLMSHLHQSS